MKYSMTPNRCALGLLQRSERMGLCKNIADADHQIDVSIQFFATLIEIISFGKRLNLINQAAAHKTTASDRLSDSSQWQTIFTGYLFSTFSLVHNGFCWAEGNAHAHPATLIHFWANCSVLPRLQEPNVFQKLWAVDATIRSPARSIYLRVWRLRALSNPHGWRRSAVSTTYKRHFSYRCWKRDLASTQIGRFWQRADNPTALAFVRYWSNSKNKK